MKICICCVDIAALTNVTSCMYALTAKMPAIPARPIGYGASVTNFRNRAFPSSYLTRLHPAPVSQHFTSYCVRLDSSNTNSTPPNDIVSHQIVHSISSSSRAHTRSYLCHTSAHPSLVFATVFDSSIDISASCEEPPRSELFCALGKG
jgi:hypothetical protein